MSAWVRCARNRSWRRVFPEANPYVKASKPRRSAVNKQTMKSFKLSWVLATLMALVLGLGCNRGGSGESKIVKLAFVTNNPSQFWKIAQGGIKKYEQEA